MPLVSSPKVPSIESIRQQKLDGALPEGSTICEPVTIAVVQSSSTVVSTPPTAQTMKEEVAMPEGQKPDTDINHYDFSTDGVVGFRLFGVGGAGKVAAIRYSKAHRHPTEITTIDTSGTEVAISGVESIRIAGLKGSGKKRSSNIGPINNFVVDYAQKTVFDQVNVIVASLSGGSGSVLCPLLVDHILRQKKIAVVVGIVDTSSELDTINALNSLRSLDAVTNDRNGYLPVILFDNSKGRALVDNGLDKMMGYLSDLLDVPYIGLDTQDRVKFLNPKVFDRVAGGVKLLCISKESHGDPEDGLGLIKPESNTDKIDSAIIISNQETLKDGNEFKLLNRCTVIFRGYHDGDGEQIVASTGLQIPEGLISELNSIINAYQKTSHRKRTDIDSELDIGDQHDSGLFL